jgi:hypothetical protein
MTEIEEMRLPGDGRPRDGGLPAPVAVLLVGGELATGLMSLGLALGTVTVVPVVALRFGDPLSRAIFSPSDEVVLLTTLGLVLLVTDIARQLQVSSAIGAFLADPHQNPHSWEKPWSLLWRSRYSQSGPMRRWRSTRAERPGFGSISAKRGSRARSACAVASFPEVNHIVVRVTSCLDVAVEMTW